MAHSQRLSARTLGTGIRIFLIKGWYARRSYTDRAHRYIPLCPLRAVRAGGMIYFNHCTYFFRSLCIWKKATGCMSRCSWLQGHLQSVAQADAASCFDKPCFGKALSVLTVGFIAGFGRGGPSPFGIGSLKPADSVGFDIPPTLLQNTLSC